MYKMLEQNEINELLNQILKESLKPSIIEIKPLDIDKIEDTVEREKIKNQFIIINDLYVKPLAKVFNYIFKNNDIGISFDIENLSIIERIKWYEKLLLSSGYNSNQIIQLLPKNEEEIEIILKAKENGFVDNNIFNNHIRVLSARNYLNHLNEIDNSIFIKSKK